METWGLKVTLRGGFGLMGDGRIADGEDSSGVSAVAAEEAIVAVDTEGATQGVGDIGDWVVDSRDLLLYIQVYPRQHAEPLCSRQLPPDGDCAMTISGEE